MVPSTSEKLLMLYGRRFPIRRGKLRVIDSFWRPAVGTQSTKRLATLKHGSFKVPCDLNDMLQRQFYFFGTYLVEDDILRCWETAARGAKVILDVGANAGIYSLAALAIQPDAIVHAFEPTPEIAARLRSAAKLNGLDRLCLHETAVLNSNGEATLKRFQGELGTNDGMNFVSPDIRDLHGERVRTVALDQFCRDHLIQNADLLKLDVQGQEHLALKGAEDLITRGRIVMIFMELNWATQAGATCPATESIRLLDGAGYYFAKPGKRLNWQKAGCWLRSLSDVVAHRVTQGMN
jgi:FkbM family methyltransferase